MSSIVVNITCWRCSVQRDLITPSPRHMPVQRVSHVEFAAGEHIEVDEYPSTQIWAVYEVAGRESGPICENVAGCRGR
jgi:hypothetical protein